jgi:hypothetical protein
MKSPTHHGWCTTALWTSKAGQQTSDAPEAGKLPRSSSVRLSIPHISSKSQRRNLDQTAEFCDEIVMQ